MGTVYIPAPTVEEVMRSFSEHMARLYRVKIIYTIQHLNGNYECVEIANPEKEGLN